MKTKGRNPEITENTKMKNKKHETCEKSSQADGFKAQRTILSIMNENNRNCYISPLVI